MCYSTGVTNELVWMLGLSNKTPPGLPSLKPSSNSVLPVAWITRPAMNLRPKKKWYYYHYLIFLLVSNLEKSQRSVISRVQSSLVKTISLEHFFLPATTVDCCATSYETWKKKIVVKTWHIYNLIFPAASVKRLSMLFVKMWLSSL